MTRTIGTTIVAGASSSGGTAVAPGVALVVDYKDHALARLGTVSGPGLTASGAVTIRATHTADASKTTAEAEAKGDSAVGADVSINLLIDWDTIAEVARYLSGTSVSVIAESTTTTGGEAHARTSGAV